MGGLIIITGEVAYLEPGHMPQATSHRNTPDSLQLFRALKLRFRDSEKRTNLPKCGVFSMMLRMLSLAMVLANLAEAQRSGCSDVQCMDEQASLG